MRDLWSNKLNMKSSIDTTPIRFDYTGDVQEYIVPKGCKRLAVDCVGGAGYVSSYLSQDGTIMYPILPEEISPIYSKGGRVQCTLNIADISILYIYVGGSCLNGFNSGTSVSQPKFVGKVYGAGASDIRSSKDNLYSRLVVAGAGGNTGTGGGTQYTAHGGAGGGLIGGTVPSSGVTSGATGGTQISGGVGGSDAAGNGNSGRFGYGGVGYNSDSVSGGAGWYGGGGGSAPNGGKYGGSGGGSSYTHPELCTEVVHTQGYSKACGNGWIILTPIG